MSNGRIGTIRECEEEQNVMKFERGQNQRNIPGERVQSVSFTLELPGSGDVLIIQTQTYNSYPQMPVEISAFEMGYGGKDYVLGDS